MIDKERQQIREATSNDHEIKPHGARADERPMHSSTGERSTTMVKSLTVDVDVKCHIHNVLALHIK